MPIDVHQGAELFGEKEFYLEEFRGRSVLVAVSPAAAAARLELGPLAAAVRDLVLNDTRVLLWWPDLGAPAERRLRGALRRAKGLARRRAQPPMPFVRIRDATFAEAVETVRAELWPTLRRERLCVLVAEGAGEQTFPRSASALAAALRIPKLVLLDPRGGLLAAAPTRLSFVDTNVLETLLRQGEAEWSGLGDRRTLLVAVGDALRGGGVESVNLCAPEGIAEELFTYEGSGTLFTRGDYCHVGPLGLDDFAQAERLLERGQREGLLKLRSPDEISEVLAVGFGATVCDRHLAGIAGLLTAPYESETVGEIVGLYTITRFKGEGIGERLVSRLVEEAERRGLAYVFACAVDERATQFFARLGFERVAPGDVPAAKWEGYDARRRARVAVLRRRLAAGVAATGA
ncbi:MAG TPA: GNAT family N-acetyltransferase [Candidatus Binatus sp.]|nr:GNAT family N-acetyltransferase [Candidatus Binatus sp.]